MTTQFPDYPAEQSPPDYAERDEQAAPEPQPAPGSYTSGDAQGFPLAVQPEAVADLLMIPTPLDGKGLGVITRAIRSAQTAVQGHLGRPPVPAQYTEHGLYARPQGWRLKNTPVIEIVSVTPETDSNSNATGLFSVVYVAGLDSVNDPDLYPIIDYITLSACYSPFVQIYWRQVCASIATRVMSASTEGQSATITDTLPSPGSGTSRSAAAVAAAQAMPGAPPPITSLDTWRISKRRVYQRPTVPGSAAPWPYSYPDQGSRDMWFGRYEQWWS